jgi:hypothetical protein
MNSSATVPDEFAVLSAIWILACNDETPVITYRSIRHRLNLPEDFDVAALVRSHGELFRLKIPPSRLKAWQDEMKRGEHMPSWIREATGIARIQLIDALKPEDGFRSQFRAELNAPKSAVTVIEWGLTHIERLRKARSEAREATAKSWQMWLVLAASLLGVVATIVAAILKK